jgi:hypothetical protein
MYKVPFRQSYTNSVADLIKQTFWCHVVIRVFPRAVDLSTDALADCYRERPAMMFEQYQSFLRA